MPTSLAFGRYANALFNLAKAQGELEHVAVSLGEIRIAVEKHSEISHLVLNSTISRDEKEDFIDKVFPDSVSKLALQFIKVLIKKQRFGELALIQEEFQRLYESNQGIQKVKSITAVALSKKNAEKLVAVLGKKLNAKINLIQEVDKKLLGGLILQFDGTEINGSYQNRLQRIKQILLV